MTTYYVAELQNTACTITKAHKILAKSLSGAKRAASNYQTFQGTVLKLIDENGHLIAWKDNGKWVDEYTDNFSHPTKVYFP